MSVSDKDSLFPIGLDAVVLECRDVKKLADFYAKLIGWQPHYQEEGEWVDLYSPNSQVKIAFQYNPEHLPPSGRMSQANSNNRCTWILR